MKSYPEGVSFNPVRPIPIGRRRMKGGTAAAPARRNRAGGGGGRPEARRRWPSRPTSHQSQWEKHQEIEELTGKPIWRILAGNGGARAAVDKLWRRRHYCSAEEGGWRRKVRGRTGERLRLSLQSRRSRRKEERERKKGGPRARGECRPWRTGKRAREARRSHRARMMRVRVTTRSARGRSGSAGRPGQGGSSEGARSMRWKWSTGEEQRRRNTMTRGSHYQ